MKQQQQKDEKPVTLEQTSISHSTIIIVPETIFLETKHHLRTATSRRRQLRNNKATMPTSFPSPCLQNAWIEQKVHPACSRALHHLQDWVTLQQHQTCTAHLFQMVFGIFWVVLLLVWCTMYWIFQTSDFEQIQVLLWKQQHRESCCCCREEHSQSCPLQIAEDECGCRKANLQSEGL